jgi:hypothetical protein
MSDALFAPRSFEVLRAKLEELEAPRGEFRRVLWVVPETLALGKTSRGAVELFLVGPPIVPTTAVVRRHLQHQSWTTELGGKEIQANRIIFPHASHFIALAALIAVELLHAGLATGSAVAQAFAAVEPIVELALRREALADESIRGLVGELLTLEQALIAVLQEPEKRSAVLDMWRGYRWGERDFLLGGTGVEVKTTLLSCSSHQISSLSQVEPSATEGEPEHNAYLLSFGLIQTESAGFTLPELVNRILALLSDPALPSGTRSPLQERIVREVEAYGAETSGACYRHAEALSSTAYQQRFQVTFQPRMYDLSDPEVRILRSADLVGTFVNRSNISYQVDLPESVSEGNPAPNWRRLIQTLVTQALSG